MTKAAPNKSNLLTTTQQMVLGIACHVGHINKKAHFGVSIKVLEHGWGYLKERRYGTYSWWEPTAEGRAHNGAMRDRVAGSKP